MQTKLIWLGVLWLVLVGIFYPQPTMSSGSFRNTILRPKRQAVVVEQQTPHEDVTPEPTLIGVDSMANCTEIDQLTIACKPESCPMEDNKMLEKCCSCLKSCCSSEQNLSVAGKGGNNTETNSNSKNSTSDIKKKITQTARQVEGFFKNVGESIKHGVNSGWDKVKVTASNVEASVRKGINTGANWVRNKTASHSDANNDMNNSNNCTDSSCTNSSNHEAVVGGESNDENNNGTSSRKRRDVPTGMMANMAMREKYRRDRYNEKREPMPETESGETGAKMTNMSSAEMIYKDGSKMDGTMQSKRNKRESGISTATRSSKRQPEPVSSVYEINPVNESDTASRSKREPAGPPSNSQSMRTTTASPKQDLSKEIKRRASPKKRATTPPPMMTTINPLGADLNNSKSDEVDVVPIRAPGSVNPDDYASPLNESSRQALMGGHLNGLLTKLGLHESSTLSSGLSKTNNEAQVSDPSTAQSKPGLCRPLSQGLQCVSLRRDDVAQCKDDAACEGSKKCCFYSCTPNSDIGICDHPIFSEFRV